MTGRRPTEQEIVLFAEGLILVEEFEALTVAGFRLGSADRQPMVALRFDGRVNNSQERREVHVAVSPTDALGVVRAITDSVLGAFPDLRDSFGRRR